MADSEILPGPNVVEGLTRKGLYEIFLKRGYTRGAEIGVWVGRNAHEMLLTMPDLELWLVDPYTPYKAGRSVYNEEIMKDVRRKATLRFTGKFKDRNLKFLIMTSLEASRKVSDGYLDFVFIDGNHSYDAAMLDLLLWVPKVRSGGMITGHDYLNRTRTNVGVKTAVDHYTSYHGITFELTDKYAEAHGPNSVYSWFWTKK